MMAFSEGLALEEVTIVGYCLEQLLHRLPKLFPRQACANQHYASGQLTQPR
jgi:hypothetical protein